MVWWFVREARLQPNGLDLFELSELFGIGFASAGRFCDRKSNPDGGRRVLRPAAMNFLG